MDNVGSIKSIINLLESFISGKDCSLAFAGRIEVELYNLFPDDDEIQDFVTCIALYRPEGGEYLYDIEEMTLKCKYILGYLKSKHDVAVLD